MDTSQETTSGSESVNTAGHVEVVSSTSSEPNWTSPFQRTDMPRPNRKTRLAQEAMQRRYKKRLAKKIRSSKKKTK